MRYICGMAAMFKCPHADCSYSGKKKANLHLHIMNKHTTIRTKLPPIITSDWYAFTIWRNSWCLVDKVDTSRSNF